MLADPDYTIARRVGLPPLAPEPELSNYVAIERVPATAGSSMIAFRADFRPRSLNYWLKDVRGRWLQEGREIEHESAHA